MPVDKMIGPNAAANAYANMSNIGKGRTAGGDDGVSFANILKQGTAESIGTIKAGEAKSAQAVAGTADLSEVVQAVTAAELTLQTVVAIRDRLVSAYQEIMRMPI